MRKTNKIIKSGNYLIPRNIVNKKEMYELLSEFTYYNPKTDVYKSSLDITKDYIEIPRNVHKLTKIFKNVEVEDLTVFPEIDNKLILSQSFKLFKGQIPVVDNILKELKKEGAVILKALPGFGKSYILPNIVSRINTNTLIIVDRTDLVNQMVGEFTANCEFVDLAVIKGNNKQSKSVSIVTFQFLIKNKEFIEDNKDKFGLIVVDECHVIGSDVFTKVVSKFNAKLRLGLSATPTRSDYMTPLLLDVMGTKIVNGDNENSLACTIINVLMEQGLYFINDNYKKSYVEFITRKIIVDFIVKLIKKLTKSNRYGLIYLTENESQLVYTEALNKAGVSTKIINKSTPSALRESIKQELEAEELKAIVSGTITQKGVSIKRLDYIINLSSLTKEAYEQLIGRLRREHPTKNDPIFFDFHFEGILLKQGWSRSSFAEVIAKSSKDKIKTIEYKKFIKSLD